MSFSFDFINSSDDSGGSSDAMIRQDLWHEKLLNELQMRPPASLTRVFPPLLLSFDQIALFEVDGFILKRVCIGEHEIDANSDLIPGVYGGGLKIWECTIDLIRFMIDNPAILPPKDGQVLELGCGHGFPAITALLMGYKTITLIDLNLEVIKDVTWPNIVVNCINLPTINLFEDVCCYSGDWLAFGKDSTERATLFDFILSSETIYSLESCQQVVYFISRYLSDRGIALLATKKFYFGVGGGTFECEKLCESLGNIKMEVVHTIEDGLSNIRDIIVIRKCNN